MLLFWLLIYFYTKCSSEYMPSHMPDHYDCLSSKWKILASSTSNLHRSMELKKKFLTGPIGKMFLKRMSRNYCFINFCIATPAGYIRFRVDQQSERLLRRTWNLIHRTQKCEPAIIIIIMNPQPTAKTRQSTEQLSRIFLGDAAHLKEMQWLSIRI